MTRRGPEWGRQPESRQQEPQQQQQQQQQHAGPAGEDAPPAVPATPPDPRRQLAAARASLFRQFQRKHYSGAHMANLDCIFIVTWLFLNGAYRRFVVNDVVRRVFVAAMATFMGTLLLLLFFRRAYSRMRRGLVLALHVMCTLLRAAAVNAMSAQQATHFRVGVLPEGKDQPGVLLVTMLAILGGPFRLLELQGLQQPWALNVAVTALYVLVHPWAAAHGIRLAYSNTMFFLVHQVHDGMAAVVDAALEALVGLPPQHQGTCSSCPGVAVYTTVCLFGSVLMPLYVLYAVEQAAFAKWCAQHAAAVAAATEAQAAAAAAGGSRGRPSRLLDQQAGQGQQPQARSLAGSWSRRRLPGGGGSSSNTSSSITRGSSSSSLSSSMSTSTSRAGSGGTSALRAQGPDAEAGPDVGDVLQHAFGPLSVSHPLLRGCVHVLALLCLLLASWVAGNVLALVILPRVLDSKQLAFYCPNRPYTPFVIAGEVYPGQ